MPGLAAAAKKLLLDISLFSKLVLKTPLREYQLAPIRAILDSILHKRGMEFVLVFPRQAGKNEAVAQLMVYLMNLTQRAGGNIIYGAIGDGLGLGIERLETHLDNPWNAGHWRTKTSPKTRILGKSQVMFMSSHPAAFARGKTAHWLLIIDEAQDQNGPHIEAVFTPMRAANNATAVYIGTVKQTSDYLWLKKAELEREQERDGRQRVFMIYPDTVTAEIPAYKIFLDTQIRKHGRHHPIVASEYFLEPLDGAGGLFPARRRAIMRGDHPRLTAPEPGRLYIATLDLAGEDEAATDPVAALQNPGRDYTVGTIFDVSFPSPGDYTPGPTFRAVDVFVDHGTKHFEDTAGQPALIHRLAAWLDHWQVAHIVGDATGVGQGVMGWLAANLGDSRVTGYNFAAGYAKAALGSAFLALIETGRFKYWSYEPQTAESPGGDSAESKALPLTDGWWFWQQVAHCGYELPPEGRFDKDLRWAVPATAKIDTPTGPQLIHDDRLISAALIAEADRLYRTGQLLMGRAESTIITEIDPLEDLGDVF